jgi:hypothetical protein
MRLLIILLLMASCSRSTNIHKGYVVKTVGDSCIVKYRVSLTH